MDPDQLASEKPADLDLHCFQTKVYPQSAYLWVSLFLINVCKAFQLTIMNGFKL